jgi:hypothetical protein
MRCLQFLPVAAMAASNAVWLLAGAAASASEPFVVEGLQRPAKVIQTPLRNLLVAEVGTKLAAPNTGRISIVDVAGNRRTLLDGLPSAPTNPADTPSGPSGLLLVGRTLYVVIGEGDPTKAGPVARTEVPNPDGPSSPLFSCVLAVHFSAAVERFTTGVAINLDDQHALRDGEIIERIDAAGRKIVLELIVDFPDFRPEFHPTVSNNVRHSHPYGIVADDDFLYVVDGGYNSVIQVDLASGGYETLLSFPTRVNPLFGTIGPPRVENVPTSIRWDGEKLLVTLLSGFPFVPGMSQVWEIDPDTGESGVLIDGLSSAIDVLPLQRDDTTVGYLALEYSTGHLAGLPGRLRMFDAAGVPVALVADSLLTPASMVVDRKSAQVIVAEIGQNRLIAVPLP